jgi:hypothetical protein
MEFRCQDLRDAGVVLVPPDSPEYKPLLAEIQRRLDHQPSDAPPSPYDTPFSSREVEDPLGAILLNRSAKPIVAWSLIYRWEESSGRSGGSNFRIGGGHPSILLPFGLSDRDRRFQMYWNTILPGSKRYLTSGKMLGDNRDVRPPTPEEEWKGSWFTMTFGDPHWPFEKMKTAILILDGIFFTDGEFVGANDLQLFEQIVCDAEIRRQVGKIARDQAVQGANASQVLAAVERITGPSRRAVPLPPGGKWDDEALREYARATLAWQISSMRESLGEATLVEMLAGWADTELPDYRRR